MAKRETVMLAHKYDETKVGLAGWFMSTKLDGVRCFWDSGITRGMLASEVPWANIAKDDRYVNPIRATGLWTRYFKTIQAPGWFLDSLPLYMLDGELWAGVQSFQRVTSIVKKLEPGLEWNSVKFMIFDCPSPGSIFRPGIIDTKPHIYKNMAGCLDWFLARVSGAMPYFPNFEAVYRGLSREIGRESANLQVLEQIELPYNTNDAYNLVESQLEYVTDRGGEGLMLRKGVSIWTPERSHHLLKVKKLQDAEGIVVGYTAGKQTDRGSKLLGLMGSLRVRMENGKEFDVSGFTEDERVMTIQETGEMANDILSKIPGERTPSNIYNQKFPIGTRITFRYRELTDAGIPKECKYWRKRTVCF